MNWGSVGEFLHMGGYGPYVWGSYAVTLALLAIEAVTLVRRERTLLGRVKRDLERTGRR